MAFSVIIVITTSLGSLDFSIEYKRELFSQKMDIARVCCTQETF